MAEPEGIAEFCQRLRPRLVGALTLFCGDANVAEDLAQEALARSWERWSTLADVDRRDAWVFAIGFNLARSRFRRAAAERRANRRWAGATVSGHVLPDLAGAVAVREAVRRLPDRQRTAIVTRYYLGLDVRTSAEVMGCEPGTVQALTHQAVTRLRAAGLGDLVEVHHDA